MAGVSGGRAGGWDALSCFTLLWAQVMVLQVVKLAHPLFSSEAELHFAVLFWPVTMALSCLLGVVVPHRIGGTLQLMVVSLIVLLFTGSQSNHVFMDMAVCLAVLAAFSPDRGRWQAQATHAVRAFLVALYLVTALHKMNSDWDNPRHSCCTMMLGGVMALKPLRFLLPMVPMATAPLMAVLTELAIPALVMLSGRCLPVAAALGCCFHLVICQMLSPMSVYPFSLLMAPPYVFLIPDRVAAAMGRLRPWAALVVASYALLCQAWTRFVTDDLGPDESPFEYPPYGAWAPGVVWCNMALTFLAATAVWPFHPLEVASVHSVVPTLRGKLLAVGVLLFGLTPYLGIRNHPALAMFSNLRTEGGRGNHLFLGDDFDLLGWQRDYVTVHETDIPALRLAQVDLAPLFTGATKKALNASDILQEFWITPPLAAWPYPPTREFRPYSMPFLELRRRLAPLRAKGATSGNVRYTRTVARAKLTVPWLWDLLGIKNLDADQVRANLTFDLASGRDSELESPLPWWQAPLARFRTFDVDYSPCRH